MYREALEPILCSDNLLLKPEDVAPLLDTTPQTLRNTAKDNPSLIGFPFTFCGKYMKIPRIPFLKFLGIEVKQ